MLRGAAGNWREPFPAVLLLRAPSLAASALGATAAATR